MYMLYHYLVNEFVAKASSKNVKNLSKVPVAIIVFGLTLTLLSLFHYFKNAALRQFAIKIIRHKIDLLRGASQIPNWMSLNTLTQTTLLQRQNQNTKLFEKRKRTRHVHNKSKPAVVNIRLEDISDDRPPSVQS